MRKAVKIALPFFFSALTFLVVFLVDTTFYSVPRFIRTFWVEREFLIVVGFVLLFFSARQIVVSWGTNYRRYLFLLALSMGGMIVSIVLLQVVCRDYLGLWGRTPLLAEYPFYWNLVSGTSVFLGVLSVGIFVFSLRYLVLISKRVDARVEWILVGVAAVVFSLICVFIEDRYTYEPIKVYRSDLFALVFYAFVAVVSFVVGFQVKIYNTLPRRWRYFYFSILLVLLSSEAVFPFSRFNFPLISYSGFIHAVFSLFPIFFVFLAVGQYVGWFSSLVTSSRGQEYHIRVLKELRDVMISMKGGDEDRLVGYICELLKSKLKADFFLYRKIGGENFFLSSRISKAPIPLRHFISSIEKMKGSEGQILVVDNVNEELEINTSGVFISALVVPLHARNKTYTAIFCSRNPCFFRFVDIAEIEFFRVCFEIVGEIL